MLLTLVQLPIAGRGFRKLNHQSQRLVDRFVGREHSGYIVVKHHDISPQPMRWIIATFGDDSQPRQVVLITQFVIINGLCCRSFAHVRLPFERL